MFTEAIIGSLLHEGVTTEVTQLYSAKFLRLLGLIRGGGGAVDLLCELPVTGSLWSRERRHIFLFSRHSLVRLIVITLCPLVATTK